MNFQKATSVVSKYLGGTFRNFPEVSQVATNRNHAGRLLQHVDTVGFKPTVSQSRARELMGANMFGVDDAIKCFGVKPTLEHIVALSEVPFSEETIGACKGTHILVAVFPISILGIRSAMKVQRLFFWQEWYDNQSFAKSCGDGKARWHLICKTPVAGSKYKSWAEQQCLIGNDDKTPEARVMVYAVIGYYKTTGTQLFECGFVRTTTVDVNGNRVYVGEFRDRGLDKGLQVDNYWGAYRHSYPGLASERKQF